ncbi:hypothetical protein FHR83_003984 [Actinoplanes campanulatus]|uniref:Uncharacterized protein n=1 Tax=Actinoplanes campanulatus TaxID=113559 RepID=A0A7W5AIC9_9ACTN|nr:hypothetical protein [Actinoplanes campanulatus]
MIIIFSRSALTAVQTASSTLSSRIAIDDCGE